MKKSFLVLAAASLLGLAACGNTTPVTPDTPTLPTEAGKVTFWFEMGADEAAVEIPEYCDIFLTGAFNGWKTAADEVVTMKQLAEDSKIYYGQYEVDYTTLEDKGFQLTVGYAADSGSGSTGVNWSYKSIECQTASGESGTENMNFVLSDDGLTAKLGDTTHHWEEVPGPVVVVRDVTLSLTVSEAVPEYVTLFAPGDYRNNWACNTDDAMTPSADRKTWTIHVDEANLGTYSMKVIAEYANSTAWSWSTVVLDDGAGGNFSLNILRANGGSTINLNERANDGEAFVIDYKNLPDPSQLQNVDAKIVIELSDTTLSEGALGIAIKGSFDGWATTNKMTVTSVAGAALVLEFTYKDVLEGNYEFGFIEFDNADTLNQLAWHSGTDGNNVPVTISRNATTYTFAGSLANGIAAKA